MLGPSGHIDTFCRDGLPDAADWPDILHLNAYPDWLNAGVELSDATAAAGHADRIALRGRTMTLTYAQLAERSDRIAQVLIEDMGVVPGNRVLLFGGNTPALVSALLGILKAGAVAVNIMPLLRAGEIDKVVDKARATHALCDLKQAAELDRCDTAGALLRSALSFDGTGGGAGELDRRMAGKTGAFTPVPVGRDDVAIIGFTSGSTGAPKAAVQFHRDLVGIADGYGRDILGITAEDVCLGTPPVAFAYGLCGLVCYPLRFGATSVLLDDLTPATLAPAIDAFGATICYTAPTAYRRMLDDTPAPGALRSLRLAVSAGETLPADLFEKWRARFPATILDGIGSTEMLSFYISGRPGRAVAGSTGLPVPGYEAKIVGDDLRELGANQPGRLAVRGPTGCRYLSDPRQAEMVSGGWNLTGDVFYRDEGGLFHFVGRVDDMILSSGYTIAGPEVEAALATHDAVGDCAVVGKPDASRGEIVEAVVVLNRGWTPCTETTTALQDHVKALIAPYKYPRSVRYVDALPKTPSGKTRRFLLRG